MGASTTDRLGIVRTMLETAPDVAVRNLDTALSGDSSASLAEVRAIVRAEAADRGLRDLVFAPVVPLGVPRADGFKQILFPAGGLSRVWKALHVLEPGAMAAVAVARGGAAGDEPDIRDLDLLCGLAVAALRARDPAMEPAIRFLEAFRPGAAEEFAGYAELIPLTRQAVKRLPGWLRNMDGENAATIRLLFKDVNEIASDASPRLVEILLAHVEEPPKLLRLISAASKRGGDRYLSSSEMAEFCERVLADIDLRIATLRLFDLDGGVEAAAAACAALAMAISEIAEFEESLDLNKEGPWGQRVMKQKGALSGLAEGHLKKASKIVGEALPMQPVRVGGVQLRFDPQLDRAPDERLVRRARTSLAFLQRCRRGAADGGYGTVRAKVSEEIAHDLDSYVQDILSMARSGDLENLDHGRAYLEVAAEFVGLVLDEKSAQIVRRRAAAAF